MNYINRILSIGYNIAIREKQNVSFIAKPLPKGVHGITNKKIIINTNYLNPSNFKENVDTIVHELAHSIALNLGIHSIRDNHDTNWLSIKLQLQHKYKHLLN